MRAPIGRCAYDPAEDFELPEDDTAPDPVVCQYCNHMVMFIVAEATGWLVSRHRNLPNVWLVRCPEHISRWAKRHARNRDEWFR